MSLNTVPSFASINPSQLLNGNLPMAPKLYAYVAAAGKNAGLGLFAGFIGVKEVRWSQDRREAYFLSPGQANKVIEELKREGTTAATSC